MGIYFLCLAIVSIIIAAIVWRRADSDRYGQGCLVFYICFIVGALLFRPLCCASRKTAENAARSKAERAEAEERARKEADLRREEAEKAKRPQRNFEKLRTFAIAESPVVWNTYQELDGAIADQGKRLDVLKAKLAEFGRDPESDGDFAQLKQQLQEMKTMRAEVMSRLEEAYFAKLKYDIAPGSKEIADLWQKAREDGVQETEMAARRIREMREAK